MPQSLTDTINLIASVISIIGGMISIGGAIYKWQAKPGAAPAKQPIKQAPPQHSPASPSPWRPSAPPSRQPTTYPPAKTPLRGVSHPVILSFATLGLLAVVSYSIELLINYAQSGFVSTGLPASSPLIGANAVLIVLNLACVVVVTVGMAVTAYRAQSNLWLAVGVVALLVSLCTIGIFSVVAFVPGVFYGLSGPRTPDAWGK